MAKTPNKPSKASESAKAKAGEPLELQANPAQPGQYNLDSVVVKGGGEGKQEQSEENTHKVGIELQDDQGRPVLTMPSGDPVVFRIKVGSKTYEGTLGEVVEKDLKTGKEEKKSQAVVAGLPAGSVDVSFPEIHGDEWKKPSTRELK